MKFLITLNSYSVIRFFDIFISILILIFISPIMILISILILVFYGNPIIYKQLRVGCSGKKFKIFKFRTMKNKIYKNEQKRLTLLGKILRKTSLDELPQLINVLKKDMSLVGPRPIPEKIENKIGKLKKLKRRKVLPGLTGFSQINFNGKKRKLSKKVSLDIYWIENYSFKNYIKILLRTPFIIFLRLIKNKTSIIK